MSVYFTHPTLGQQIESIAGVYAYTEEKCIQIDGKNVLYFIGFCVTNKSCCGVGGCMFANVAGFVKSYGIQAKEGKIISEVEPIDDEITKHYIEKLIKLHGVLQVNFLS
ncbi:MAG: hypothetical protein N3F66_05545 [Spirochaetes bacterium]|nr:hypothetical protein [Spirochaetota bacterium]